MSNFDRNWHIVSFKVNNRYWYMKQCTFQDNAWALFSDIKLHAILLCCFSLGSPFESATFGPEFPAPLKNSHREEEVVSLHSANWLSLNWNTRRKRISFVVGPELGFNWHTKREPISVEEEEGGRRVKQRQAECQAVQWDVFLEPWPWTRQHLRYYQTYQINWPNQLAKLIEDV